MTEPTHTRTGTPCPLTLAEKALPFAIGTRTWLHRHPELSFAEKQTAAFVADQLRQMGLKPECGIGGLGIRCFVGERAAKTVVLRADMDALPITEDPAHDPCSLNNGVMHACGHDMHTASLLTVAKILSELATDARRPLPHPVMLVFQPGEEESPGGAKLMIEDGLFEDVDPLVVIGAHVQAEMPAGDVGFRPGPYMASGNEIHIRVSGHGGHGGMPHTLNDTVLAACQTVVALQEIVAREVPATQPAVISFGKIDAPGATNVIPDEVYIAGTMRMMNEEWRARVIERVKRVAENICAAYNCAATVDVREGYPCVHNDLDATKRMIELTESLLGTGRVRDLDLRMTAEDFGHYTHLYPSVFYRFGTARHSLLEKGISPGAAHTAQFDPDPEALKTSVAVMLNAALNY